MRQLMINKINEYTDNGKYPPIDGDGNEIDMSKVATLPDYALLEVFEAVVAFAG